MTKSKFYKPAPLKERVKTSFKAFYFGKVEGKE